jgi:integrase
MQRNSRKEGPDVWQFRWSETRLDGKRLYRKKIVGTVEQYPDEGAARRAVVGLVSEINTDARPTNSRAMTVAQLCDHLAQSRDKENLQSVLDPLDSPSLPEIRVVWSSWLRTLPLAESSCAKIRNLMSVLFNHACRYELFDRNPIYLVRQSAKRRTPPAILVPAEIKALIDGLALRERTLVLLAASTGLRQSEIFGLKWGDIDFERGTMSVIRSIVYGVVGPCKTEASQ